MKFEFNPSGVCSRKYIFEIENNVIKDCQIIGGCAGNTLGISRIIKGMTLDEVIEDFDGVKCGLRPTSCPDQLARALKQFKEQNA